VIFWIAEARSASSMPERVSLRSSRPPEHHGQVPALLAVAAALTRTPEDDAALLDAYRTGHGIDSLAGTFGRQPGAIRSRLARLAVQFDDAEQHPGAADPQVP
jgi:hypothetical protein